MCHIGNEYLVEYATQFGLDKIISGRYSWLFVFNLIMLDRENGIDPQSILDEIKSLEGLGPPLQTKPASEFKWPPLKGLWHKHFFAAKPSLITHNILNHLSGNKLRRLIAEVFDSRKSLVVTNELIGMLSNKVVVESFEDRAAANKLTGEWIIFAKYNTQNYYLCITKHGGDENIARSIKTACFPQFSFLSTYLL